MPIRAAICFAKSPALCQVEILLDKEPFRYTRHFLPVLHVYGYNIKSFKITYPIDFIMFHTNSSKYNEKIIKSWKLVEIAEV
jgi:hypothetical protein